jgi:hypothetical protein
VAPTELYALNHQLCPLIRFIISDIKPESCKFEQSFSTDNGKTWEVNWIAIDTRVKE